MPPSLRKACHACTKAKRRCRPELPKCSRCLEKGLDCTYDLEPVTNTETNINSPAPSREHLVRQPLPAVIYDSIASAHAAAIQSYAQNGLDQPQTLPAVSTPEPFALAFEQLSRIPLSTFQHQSTPFVHAQVLTSSRTKPLSQSEEASIAQAALADFVQKKQPLILDLDINNISYKTFLASFHELMALLLYSALAKACGQAELSKFDALQHIFHVWTQHFRSKLPRTLDTEPSAWKTWAFAESIRRTFIFTTMVQVVVEMVYHGFFYYRPMIEALPFDVRTGLWEANTEEEWRSAVANDGGVECSLISWHEFIENGGPEPRKQYDGMLQRLLLVGHFSRAAVRHQSSDEESE
ncbi:hypothetical protein EDD36DRAFT_445322 [Exophiala viscosa]|uniref:Zn(2)-C6 fungal-type domain-containing protein n=1 Tax=Exophiala viscosa TaxID=2486360 RepID=A0AAN6IA75_9EURO|nr:hypothetical protein EDD36DRAFT_445322 [Exophiala viscosa]